VSKEAVFTLKIEPDLRADFMAEAAAVHRSASQILRELMREYVESQRQSREYDEYVAKKIAKAREQVQSGQYLSNDVVSAKFARLRADLQKTVTEQKH
jgi:hypothetical protein